VDMVLALRRLRFTGPETADVLGMPPSTVSVVLKRSALGELRHLCLEPVER
jgi:hypothetical protein